MVKWNPLGLEGDHAVNFRNAYTKGKMYLHGVSKGDKVNKVGRPSKEAIFKEANKLVEADKLREEAFKRIFNSDALSIQIPPTD
mgnify:CR=1 FL=1